MPKVIDARYGKLWVRLICCLAVAVGVWRTLDLVALRGIEELVYSTLLAEYALSYASVPGYAKTAIVFALCLLPAMFRVERPLWLMFVGVLIGLIYFGCILVALFAGALMLPVSAPFLGLILSTTVLDTMAWSEERSRRRDLEQMEQAKQNFTDMLVHDLTNRMSSIKMSFSLLEKNMASSDARTNKLLQNIRSSSDRMQVQINALLDIRKIQEGKMTLNPETIRLTDFLLSTIDEFQPVAEFVGIQVKLVSPEDVSTRISVDRDIISRVLANLFWNALAHAPENSDVEVGYEHGENGEETIFVANAGDPIPQDQQEAIFDKFVSGMQDIKERKLAGAGLGLSFCKLAVEAHQGRIRVESPWRKTGDGVRVDITLPGATGKPATA